MRYDTFSHRFEVFAADEQKGIIEGYGSVFDEVHHSGAVVEREAFNETLKEHRQAGTMPALLDQHDSRQPIGVWEHMETDEHGLRVRGRLLIDKVQRATEVFELLKAKALNGLSIGFYTRDDSFDEVDGTRHIKKLDLVEVSVVTFPNGPSARVDTVHQADLVHTARDFESFLREAGGFSVSRAKYIASLSRDAFARRDVGTQDRDEALELHQDVLHELEQLTAKISKV